MQPSAELGLLLVVLEALAHIFELAPAPETLQHVTRSFGVAVGESTVAMLIAVEEHLHAFLALHNGGVQRRQRAMLLGVLQGQLEDAGLSVQIVERRACASFRQGVHHRVDVALRRRAGE